MISPKSRFPRVVLVGPEVCRFCAGDSSNEVRYLCLVVHRPVCKFQDKEKDGKAKK